MGWTYTHREKGVTTKEFFLNEFKNADITEDGHGVVDVASPNPREAYIAYRYPNGNVNCIICLLDYQPSEYCNFGYKDMDEMMGPFYYNCPERIFKLLTPLTGNDEWRAEVVKQIMYKKPSVRIILGGVYRVESDIMFTNNFILTDGMYIRCLSVKNRRFERVILNEDGMIQKRNEIYYIRSRDVINSSLKYVGKKMEMK